YEKADDDELSDGDRSLFDVVMLDKHSTDRLAQGNYFFWGTVPKLEGVALGPRTSNVFIVNWDESHPVLRHVTVETIRVYEEFPLTVPSDATALLEGETTPILAYFSREGSDFLICSFPLVLDDPETGSPLMNTTWVTKAHFPVFMYNAVQYLAANVSASGLSSVRPGSPIQIPTARRTRRVRIVRPDGTTDEIPTAGVAFAHYARTRIVGVYEAVGGLAEKNHFAVNLFSQAESDVTPSRTFTLGATAVATSDRLASVNRPFWPQILLAILAILMLEWIIYNKRVFV
ncbi:MAG: hypothetical protein ACE5GE_00645, partial [Phycisphaerae bacterium]